ncbi:MAG TPA: aldehyde dehydrogenase family protein, partial [Desulfopila sp.]|nr:aldehyde dehydrogenase family protein [Desulfopila sp.]
MTQISTINPATEETLATYDVISADAAFKKVEACHAAFLKWREKTHKDRAPYLLGIAKILRKKGDDFAKLMTQEMGKLFRDGKTEIEICARILEYTAENGPTELADDERTHSGGKKRGIVTFSPIGVIYSIQPWNFPIYQPVRVLAANLMAGNAVILKHASICTGSGLMLRDVCVEAGLPEGLFDMLVIDHETSDQIIEHKLVRGVTMTGSDAAGRYISQKASKHLKKSVLELGSNDAYLVLEDADVELAAKTCVLGRLYNNGQTCVSAKRFVVTEAVYDTFTRAFVEQMSAVNLGDPMKEDTELGTVSSKEQFDKLSEQVSKSL